MNQKIRKPQVIKFPGPQNFQLQKGLDDKEAYRRMKSRSTRDFRGYNYNPKTGKGQLI